MLPPVRDEGSEGPAGQQPVFERGRAFPECKGRKSSSSIRSVCANLADEVGELASFSYKGEPVDEAALAKCNDK